MLSTMADYPLTIGSILEFGIKIHGESQVQTWTAEGPRKASFRQVGARARQRSLCALAIPWTGSAHGRGLRSSHARPGLPGANGGRVLAGFCYAIVSGGSKLRRNCERRILRAVPASRRALN